MAMAQGDHAFFHYRRTIIAGVLAGKSGLEIIDVGAGTGANIASLSKYGSVDIVEPDSAALGFVSEGSVRSTYTSLESSPVGKYDVLCLFDVLEHIDDHAAFLLDCSRRLKPSGIMLITVPAHQFLYCARDSMHHHKRRYSYRLLDDLCRSTGLSGRISWTFFLPFPLIATSRIVYRLFPALCPKNDLSSSKSSYLGRFCSYILCREASLIATGKIRFPFGCSLLAVVGRSNE